MPLPSTTKPLNILLADDDIDDRFFFGLALNELPFPKQFSTVEDGEKLMAYLLANKDQLPDVLFLDLNMPRKNGSECLGEIKIHPMLKDLPVVIYSTSMHEDIADLLYKTGASYYILKRDYTELVEILDKVFVLMAEKKFKRPARDKFILSMAKA